MSSMAEARNNSIYASRRRRNAIAKGQSTPTGQKLEASAGMGACLDALESRWRQALAEVGAFNANAGVRRRGVGIGCMWYGIGNTSMSNPSRRNRPSQPR